MPTTDDVITATPALSDTVRQRCDPMPTRRRLKDMIYILSAVAILSPTLQQQPAGTTEV